MMHLRSDHLAIFSIPYSGVFFNSLRKETSIFRENIRTVIVPAAAHRILLNHKMIHKKDCIFRENALY